MTEIFNGYAEYYDLLYSDKDYDGEANYIDSHIKQIRPQSRRILELGCGTGAHAERLARMGYTVHGIDQSKAMIAKAKQRSKSLPKEISARLNFSVGDVRSISLQDRFDVVISLFHVFSYQTKDQSVEAMIHTASSHLLDGGVFIFDYWNGSAVLTQRPEIRIKHLENNRVKVTRIAEPVTLENLNTVDVNYSIFIEDVNSGQIVRINETHSMRYFFLPELKKLFDFNEWSDCKSYSWLRNSPLTKAEWAGVTTVSKRER